jgi:hypothetical protein
MHAFTFRLVYLFRTDQVPHPNKAMHGSYKTRSNGRKAGSAKREVTEMASSGFQQYQISSYNGNWQTLCGAGGQDRTAEKG